MNFFIWKAFFRYFVYLNLASLALVNLSSAAEDQLPQNSTAAQSVINTFLLTNSSDSDTGIVVDENTFVAYDVETLQEGVQALINHEKTKLYLSAMIECADNSCTIRLDGLSDIIIFGSHNTTTGIRRTDGYDTSPALILNSCSNVLLQDISFDDMEGERYQNPSSTIWVDESSDIRFNNVTISGSKGVMAVGVSGTTNFSLIDTTVEDAGAFGLWVDESRGLLVQGCSFKDNRSNAIFIENVHGDTRDDNLIVSSDFNHNHCDAVFNACNGPCPGGQLDIMNAQYLTIRGNTIHDGKIETYPAITLYSSGIELNDGNHMRIEHNTIWNNTGNCIYKNSSHTLTDVYVENNSFDSSNTVNTCTRNLEQVIMNNNTCKE